MRCFAFVLGLTLAACDPGSGDVTCEVECPPGTKVLNFDSTTYEDSYRNGAFVLVINECETTCAPITPCLRPNVPVATETSFECQGLPGLSDIPGPSDLDLSWIGAWDETAVSP